MDTNADAAGCAELWSRIEKGIEEVVGRAREFAQASHSVGSPEQLELVEKQASEVGDQLFRLLMLVVLQRAVNDPVVKESARELVQNLKRRLRSDGREGVEIRTSRGGVVKVETPYYRERSRKGGRRRPGLYPALVVLGIWDRCTPKLASDVSCAVAMLGSLAEAAAHLGSQSIDLDVKTVRAIAYRCAARARSVQASEGFRWGESVAGRRVVVSLDGGRIRVRRKKRGPKTPKGRSRFHADWREPKLLIIYVVDPDGRPCRSWAPVIDGTLRGPDAAFSLLRCYAKQIELATVDKVLFVADGAPWIWTRIEALVAALALQPQQVLMLVDFYHAAKQLSDAIKHRRWSAQRRARWLNQYRRCLRRGDVDSVILALKPLCRGRNAKAMATCIGYFTRNHGRFAYPRMHRLGLPMGSGAMESAIRRVVNLRIQGASIYWLPANVEAILMLRSFYKANRWRLLQRMATAPEFAAR